jgi:hypothetical protein
MHLRDFFAAQFAVALTSNPPRLEGPRLDGDAALARRAYDLADAMLRERRLRGHADEEALLSMQELVGQPSEEDEAFFLGSDEKLLDEPAPLSEREEELDPLWESLRHDPAWESEPKWGPPLTTTTTLSERPGLARTVPEPLDGGLRKKA